MAVFLSHKADGLSYITPLVLKISLKEFTIRAFKKDEFENTVRRFAEEKSSMPGKTEYHFDVMTYVLRIS